MKNKLTIFSLLSVIFIDSIGWGIVYPVFAAFFLSTSSLGSDSKFETALAVYPLFMFLFSPIIGVLSDQFGRKNLLIASMIGSGVGFAISALGLYSASLILIILGRVISGVTAGGLGISQAAISDLSTDQNKAYRLGLIALANGVGFACGPFVGGMLIDITRSTFVPLALLTVLCIFGVLIISVFFNPLPSKESSIKIKQLTMKGIFRIDSLGNEGTLFCSLFFAMLGYITFFNFLPIYLHTQLQFSAVNQGYFLGYFALIFSSSLIYIFPKILRCLSLKKIVYLSLLIHVLFYLILLTIKESFLIYIYVVPIAIFAPFLYVGLVTLISNATTLDIQGKVMGMVGSVCAFTWTLGPFLVAIFVKSIFISPIILAVLFLFMSTFILKFSKNKFIYL